MALIKYKLGDLIEQSDERNTENKYTLENVKGISIQKIFIETKANMEGVSLKPYKLVKTDDFAYVTVTSRNGEKITLAHNITEDTYIISSSYIVFRVKRDDLLLSDYLFMHFNRFEFDRFSRFNSWGSARETFSWEDFCDIDIDLPSLEIQKNYVDIYNAMVSNQECYERGLEDLKLTCDAYIDELRRDLVHQPIGKYISLSNVRNDELIYGIDDVKGISIEKKFIPTKANMEGVSLKPYAVVFPSEFAYVTVTSRNGEKISLAYNDSDDTYICSSSYIVFSVNDESVLLPSYLALLLERNEFNRYARFHSWGSARETFDWDEMCAVEIPIPDISIQKDIVDIFTVYKERKNINERLKNNIKDICPILIKGSIEEARKEA